MKDYAPSCMPQSYLLYFFDISVFENQVTLADSHISITCISLIDCVILI